MSERQLGAAGGPGGPAASAGSVPSSTGGASGASGESGAVAAVAAVGVGAAVGIVGLEARLAAVTSLAARARSAARAAGSRLVVLVDGRSGTGKTTLAGALAGELGAQLVHLDDVYPGWDGLRAAADAVVSDVLGGPSGHRRWDWGAGAPADWVDLDPSEPIVVEGCGALSRASAPLAVLRIWLTAEDQERWRRAIGRDGAVFAAEWDRWAAQEDAFIAAEDPATLADVVLRS